MRQSNICAQAITVADPNVAVTAPSFTMLNVNKAWQYSTGNGVPVAVIDTGVNPNPRLPVVPGGDYIMGGDGLMDCDAHGTIVASLIGAAPQGIPMPPPMPPGARIPAAGRPAARTRCRPAAGWNPGAAGAATAPAAGDDHGDQTRTAAAPSRTAPPARGSALERAGRAESGWTGQPGGAGAAARRPGRGGRRGTARDAHLHPAVVAGV